MKDQAQQAASTAKDEAQNVAGVAKEQAQNIAGEAQQQAADLIGEARRQLEDQSRSQLDRLVGSLQELADDLERMARGDGAGSGMARTIVTEVSDRARSISSQVQGREPAEVLDQVRGFARRKPGTFLLGAAVAGVLAGRLTTGIKAAHTGSGIVGGSSDSGDQYRTTTGANYVAQTPAYTGYTETGVAGTAGYAGTTGTTTGYPETTGGGTPLPPPPYGTVPPEAGAVPPATTTGWDDPARTGGVG
jgi:hypothetical protein